jgi:hypothetical protein
VVIIGKILQIKTFSQLTHVTRSLHHLLAFTTLAVNDILKHIKELNPLTPNDLQRRRAARPLKIKIPSKNIRENQQIEKLFIQFINYVW